MLEDLPPEIRYDPIHNWPVIFAPDRAKRPFQFSAAKSIIDPKTDPFAEGHEDQTPPEVDAFRHADSLPDQPGWQVRVIPNKYPALISTEQVGQRLEKQTQLEEQTQPAHGIHEVIIECPQTESHLTHLPLEQAVHIFRMYRQRLRKLKDHEQIKHAVIFKNHGQAAGASILHAHSQLMAVPFIPPLIDQEMRHCKSSIPSTGKDYYSTLISQEQEAHSRILQQTDHLLAYCPKASRFPFEVHILPLQPAPHFHEATDDHVAESAEIIWSLLKKLEQLTGESTSYNYVLKTAPWNMTDQNHFRWHWEIYPRLSGWAGLELGMNAYVNPLFPEVAVQKLREP